MPLDINKDPEAPRENDSIRPPVLYSPVRQRISAGRIFILLFILIVIASAVFLVRTFFFQNETGKPAEAKQNSIADTSMNAHPVTPSAANPEPTGAGTGTQGSISVPVQKKEQSVREKKASPPVIATNIEKHPPAGTGQYTIYIAAYRGLKFAESEVSRWNDAGYQAFIVKVADNYCIGLGAYPDRGSAQKTAQQLSEAFENGYWIGTLNRGERIPPSR